jgi:hypothetical protein
MAKYQKRYKYADDVNALKAGQKIAAGQATRDNLIEIFDWKTKGRGRSRISKNTDDEISDALILAASARTDRAALAVLLGLRGVAIPVGSAILTAVAPERYSIIDFRALWSLSVHPAPVYTVDYYIKYLEYCRATAPSANLSLRSFDRALWQYSKEHQPAGNEEIE